MFTLYDTQTGRYFGDGQEFNTHQEAKEALMHYHSGDVSHTLLREMSLDELCAEFGWRVENGGMGIRVQAFV